MTEHPVFGLLGGTLTHIGASHSGDELFLSFQKNGAPIHLAVGCDADGLLTISLSDISEDETHHE